MPPIFTNELDSNVGIVVAIPAYAEKDLIASLQSLLACNIPNCSVEIIALINHPINADKELKQLNEFSSNEAKKWAVTNSKKNLRFLISDPIELPKKHAGAGLARKVAMDEAARRLQNSKFENTIIACFDADATCSPNYLTQIESHFIDHPKSMGCSINFEHPVNGLNTFLNEGIIQYELHLRYYQAAMAFANHPHAEFTVGSSMAVTCKHYIAQGGMNRRKAGEDFWFMLKLMMAGEVTAITEATVYPSSRESFRVPFGTGRAMSEMTNKQNNIFLTTPFSSFKRLQNLLIQVDELYKEDVQFADDLTFQFLESVRWQEIIAEIREYTTDLESFRKRFYRWFNAFMVMKFFHWLRDQGIEDKPVLNESMTLLKQLNISLKTTISLEALELFRAKKRVKPTDFTLQ
ncbi:MAG: glycosyltransferase [Salibacteraceae bacterium]